MTDKIEEIRARHQEGIRAGADADRAYLLAEVERLIRERDWARADVDQLRGDREKMLLDERDFVRKHRAEIERLTRERDEARAEVERLRAENERLTRQRDEARAEVERLREVIRTIRARCVEMDDSDAVSETLDISSAALEDEP